MEKVRLVNTILKSTNSGSYATLTKEFLLNFGFTVTTSSIVTYNKDGFRIDMHLDSSGMFDMFTEYVFLRKGHVVNVKNDWYQVKTIKEFLDIFNEYRTYIQYHS